jgi:hypothetical protein
MAPRSQKFLRRFFQKAAAFLWRYAAASRVSEISPDLTLSLVPAWGCWFNKLGHD